MRFTILLCKHFYDRCLDEECRINIIDEMGKAVRDGEVPRKRIKALGQAGLE